MRFGPWLAIERAQSDAPAAPGVLQARADSLLELPRGKSAMVFYAASSEDETLADFVHGPGAAGLAGAAGLGARWVRFAPSPQPQVALARLLRQFSERFGAAPRANQGQS